MKRARIYIDTSVIGGAFDREFEAVTRKFFAQLVEAGNVVVISDLTVAELDDSSSQVRERLDEWVKSIPPTNRDYIDTTDEMTELAEKYIQAGVVGEASRRDATHIAIATVAKVDILLSWNFKHIVNWGKIKRYNSINLAEGYSLLEIRSPMEVVNEDRD
jgi:hypothetical protein